MTGHLSLVPVKVRAPESLHGLDINPSYVPQSLLGLITGQETNGGLFFDSVTVTVRPGTQDLFYLSGSSTTSDGPQDRASHQTYCGKTEGEESSASRDHPALQDVIDLLKGHFSIKGHLDNGCQDIMMGKCNTVLLHGEKIDSIYLCIIALLITNEIKMIEFFALANFINLSVLLHFH